jgi:hypothetical protein
LTLNTANPQDEFFHDHFLDKPEIFGFYRSGGRHPSQVGHATPRPDLLIDAIIWESVKCGRQHSRKALLII